MAMKIEELTDSDEMNSSENTQLVAEINNANREKEEMSQKLQMLEEIISELENQINGAMKERNHAEMGESEVRSEEMNAVVANLVEEKKILEAKYF